MEIEKYLKIPFKNKGRDWNGVDCWGLVHLFYKEEFGIQLPPYLDVNEKWDEVGKIAAVMGVEKNKWKKVAIPQFGDVIMFNIVGIPVHVGIALDKKMMLHALDKVGVSIEPYKSLKWEFRLEGFYRYE